MSEVTAVQRGDRTFAYLTLLPSVALILLLIAVPTLAIFALSVQDVTLGRFTGEFAGLANFRAVLGNPDFYSALINTFIWVFGNVGMEMLLGTGLALLLHQSFRFRGLVRAIVLAPFLMPTVVAVLVWRYMFDDIVGIANSLLIGTGLVEKPVQWLTSPRLAMFSVILIGTWKFAPFVVLAILGILQSIPTEQYEAAKLDGANAVQRFMRITVPYILPVFILTALLRTIWSFHKFDLIYLLTGGGPVDATTTLPILIFVKGFQEFEVGGAAAIALIMFGIILVFLAIYLLLMRWSEKRQ